jgi:uncharacterized protein YkwD
VGKFKTKISNLTKKQTFYVAATVAILLGFGGGAVFAYREYQVKRIAQQKQQEVKSAINEGGEAQKEPAKTEEGSGDQNTENNAQAQPTEQNQADANATVAPTTAPAPTAPKTTYIAPKTTYTAPKTAPTVSAPPATTNISTVAGAQSYVASRIFTLVNSERASKGLGALRYQSQLGSAADIRAGEEAILSFVGTDHVRPNGTSFSTVFGQVGYTGYTMVGENLAWGYMPQFAFNQTNLDNLASKIFTQWKNSPSHYAAMIRPEYNQTGVGVVIKLVNGRLYYFATQEFGRRSY